MDDDWIDEITSSIGTWGAMPTSTREQILQTAYATPGDLHAQKKVAQALVAQQWKNMYQISPDRAIPTFDSAPTTGATGIINRAIGKESP